jgi:prepilin-type N-terminal cleavage/methylation domain-containing protein
LKRHLKGKLFNISGFTFIEVLAAMVILSVALIPLLIWVPTSIQTKLQSERKTTAIFLAQGEIEELHYRIIKNFDRSYNASLISFSPPYQDFRYNVTDSAAGDLKTISVKAWHIEKPEDATIFSTQVARR